MKVWELPAFGQENLALTDKPVPEPGPGQVALDMRAASLNYRDLVVIRGGYGKMFKPPIVPVSDGVGVVAAVGDGVTRLAPGDRVAPMFFENWIDGEPAPEKFTSARGGEIDGVLSESMVAEERGLAKVPDYLSDVEGACLPCAALTAWSAVATQGRLGPGETILIQGTGGVAVFALQFATMAGATAIVISSSDEKLDKARALGADHAINYLANPDWERAALAITDGRGVDHVLELGGGDTLPRSLKAVRVGGFISLIGVLSGARADFVLPAVVSRNIRVQGVTVGSRTGFEAMVRAMEAHETKPAVDSVYGFDDVHAALARLESGAHFGKVCVDYAG